MQHVAKGDVCGDERDPPRACERFTAKVTKVEKNAIASANSYICHPLGGHPGPCSSRRCQGRRFCSHPLPCCSGRVPLPSAVGKAGPQDRRQAWGRSLLPQEWQRRSRSIGSVAPTLCGSLCPISSFRQVRLPLNNCAVGRCWLFFFFLGLKICSTERLRPNFCCWYHPGCYKERPSSLGASLNDTLKHDSLLHIFNSFLMASKKKKNKNMS